MSMSRSGLVLAAVALMLNGCGGGNSDKPRTYAIGANVNGLTGSRLALSNNGVSVAITPGPNGRVTGLFAGLPNGASYDITIATQPIAPVQNCVVSGGKGTIAGADVEVSVACTTTPARFLLAQNALGADDLCIGASSIDATSGALTATTGSPVCGGVSLAPGGLGYPYGPMAVHPQGKFIYVGSNLSRIGCLCGFSIDRDSGAITYAQQLAVYHMYFVAAHPSGRFLFSTNGSPGVEGSVVTQTVDPVSGALTFSSALSFEAEPGAVIVDPLGRFVYALYPDPSPPTRLMSLVVDPNTGALSRSAPLVAVADYSNLVAHPSGKFLYAWHQDSITAYSVATADGALTPIPHAPFVALAGTSLSFVTIDPNGNYLYAFNTSANSIFAFAIDKSRGELAPINGSPFATQGNPSWAAIEPQGRFMYVSNKLGVSAYAVDASNGALTPVGGSPFAVAFGGRIDFSY